MRAQGLKGAKNRAFTQRLTIRDPNAPRVADLVNRDFTAPGPDRLWVADFTETSSWQGVVYFSFVIDVYSRRVVGWQLAVHRRDELVIDALSMALACRQPGADVGLVHHSDAGSQYTSHDFQAVLAEHGVAQSIGTVADAYDNAMAESFVDTFKTELINDRVWRTTGELQIAIVEWISWFNNERLHESLGDVPPVEYEDQYKYTLQSAWQHPR
jgi:putative transposase